MRFIFKQFLGVFMETKRKFRYDFFPLNKEYKFSSGDIATVVKEDIPNVVVKINGKSYLIPYRDFIVLTTRVN